MSWHTRRVGTVLAELDRTDPAAAVVVRAELARLRRECASFRQQLREAESQPCCREVAGPCQCVVVPEHHQREARR
jgi:hypothetical protein